MNYISKISALLMLLFVIPGIMTQGKSAFVNFDKVAYYAALASGSVDEINSMLNLVKESPGAENQAYEGALLMKKAGLVKKVKEKLSLFKSGRSKLEEAIKKDEGNAEYHFLRLIIQENSPKIVKYKGDLKKDTEVVRKSFKVLPPAVQQVIKDYSKKSVVLKPTDF